MDCLLLNRDCHSLRYSSALHAVSHAPLVRYNGSMRDQEQLRALLAAKDRFIVTLVRELDEARQQVFQLTVGERGGRGMTGAPAPAPLGRARR